MSATHPTATRNLLADAIGDQLDSGKIEFQTSGDAEVATCPLNAAAFPSAIAGVITAAAITSDTNATGGTIAKVSVQTSGSAEVVAFPVADIVISSAIITAGDEVGVDSFTYAASL
ncbi:MAG: hypothetical protein COB09_18590 [Thalassobium sp.]|nr:MAG: hypothetical protein COB09_18590 [Thalassobium sp.]